MKKFLLIFFLMLHFGCEEEIDELYSLPCHAEPHTNAVCKLI